MPLYLPPSHRYLHPRAIQTLTLPLSLNAVTQLRQQHTRFSLHIEISLFSLFFPNETFLTNHDFDSVNHYFCSLDGVYMPKRSDCAIGSGDVEAKERNLLQWLSHFLGKLATLTNIMVSKLLLRTSMKETVCVFYYYGPRYFSAPEYLHVFPEYL